MVRTWCYPDGNVAPGDWQRSSSPDTNRARKPMPTPAWRGSTEAHAIGMPSLRQQREGNPCRRATHLGRARAGEAMRGRSDPGAFPRPGSTTRGIHPRGVLRHARIRSLCAGLRHGRGPREWNGIDTRYVLVRCGRPADGRIQPVSVLLSWRKRVCAGRDTRRWSSSGLRRGSSPRASRAGARPATCRAIGAAGHRAWWDPRAGGRGSR